MLNVRAQRDPQGVLVKVEGALERQNYNECLRAIEVAQGGRPCDVRLDLTGVARLTSVAIAGLWRLAHDLSQQKAQVRLLNVPAPLRGILSTCGLSEVPGTPGTYEFAVASDLAARGPAVREGAAPAVESPAKGAVAAAAPPDGAREEVAKVREEAAAQVRRAEADAQAARAEVERLRSALAAAESSSERARAEGAERLARADAAYARVAGEAADLKRAMAERDGRLHQILRCVRESHQASAELTARLLGALEVPAPGGGADPVAPGVPSGDAGA